MQRYSKYISGLTAALVLFVGGCGDDPLGVNSGDELTDDEIQAIFNAFGGAIGDASPSASRVAAHDGIQLAEIEVNQSVSVTAPCALGGEIALEGSVNGIVDDETYESDLQMGITAQFDGCVVQGEANTVTVDGEIVFDAHFLLDADAFSVDGDQIGGFSFTTSDERNGSCAIEIEFSASYTTGTSATSTVSGSVCGRSAEQFEAYTG
jgi:hypothetical protein